MAWAQLPKVLWREPLESLTRAHEDLWRKRGIPLLVPMKTTASQLTLAIRRTFKGGRASEGCFSTVAASPMKNGKPIWHGSSLTQKAVNTGRLSF